MDEIILENKKILFMFYERGYLDGTSDYYIVYEDGTVYINSYFFDLPPLIERDQEKDEHLAKIISDFIDAHEKEIRTLPKNLDNDQILDGAEMKIQFRDKITEGSNFLLPVTKESHKFRNINKMIKLVNELKEAVGFTDEYEEDDEDMEEN